jgi:AraC-like DNA-binding protein
VNPKHPSIRQDVTIKPQAAADPGAEWDQFISRLVCAARAGGYTKGASSKELAACAAAPVAPMTRLLAQALLIRLDRAANGGPVSLSLLEQHAALPEQAVRLLMASIGKSGEPRVRVLLSRVASGSVRSRTGVAAIAYEMGVSVPYLSRLVHDETGASIHRHINARRLLHAADLLSKTFLRLNEIAAKVGYKHTQHLDRSFSRGLGIRPIELRSYGLREACRAYMGGRHDALFTSWVRHRLPALIENGSHA